MRRKKFPQGHELRKQLAEFLVKKNYTAFEICALLGHSLRDFQSQVNSPFLTSHERRLINDDAYREEVITNLVQEMYASKDQTSEGSPQSE